MEIKKNRKLRGSVLLTVVFVMAILIVFLFGTMTLAMAANNRAHVNYSSAQTGITARTVAESAIKALKNNTPEGEAYKEVISKLNINSTPIKVPVKINGDDKTSMGHDVSVEIAVVGQKAYYDQTNKAWQNRDVIKFTGTATLGGVKKTASIYAVKHLRGDDPGSGSGGAGFVTTAGAELKTQTNIFGGAYISLPTKIEAQSCDYYNDPYGLRSANLTVVPLHDNGDNAKTDACFVENDKSVIQADFYVCNNLAIHNLNWLVMSRGKGVTVWGDLYFNSESTKLCYDYIGQDRDDLGNETNKVEFSFHDIPYIFVNGRLFGDPTLGSNGKVKNGNAQPVSFPLNVFCGSFEASNMTNGTLACNIYCMDEGADNIIGFMNPGDESKMYSWASSVITRTDNGESNCSNGDICSKGNLTLKNIKVAGNVRVEGDLDFIGNVSVGKHENDGTPVEKGGYIVVGGELSYSGKSGADAAKALVEDKVVYEVFYKNKVYRYSESGASVEDTPADKPNSDSGDDDDTDISNPLENPEYLEGLDIENYRGYYIPYNPQPVYNSASSDDPEDQGMEATFDNEDIYCYLDPWGNPLEIEGVYGKVDLVDDEGYTLVDEEGNPIFGYGFKNGYTAENISTIYYLGNHKLTKEIIDDFNLNGNTEAVRDFLTNEIALNIVSDGNDNYATHPRDNKTIRVNEDGGYYYVYYETNAVVNVGEDLIPDPYKEVERDTEGRYIITDEPQATRRAGTFTPPGGSTETKPVEIPVAPGYSESKGGFPYDTAIYPVYAEKDVICGKMLIKKDPGGKDTEDNVYSKSDTQIVSLIEEVLKDVADPYKSINLQSLGLLGQYNEIMDDPKVHYCNTDDKKTDNLSQIYRLTSWDASAGKYTIGEGKDSSQANIYIDHDCYIENLKAGANGGRAVVFNPGDKDILVVIGKHFENDSGIPIIVDDTTGKGTVSFWICDGAQFNIQEELYTLSMWRTLKGSSPKKQFYLNSPNNKVGENLANYSPNVNIYGGNGTLNAISLSMVMANIISPNLTGTVGGNNPPGITSLFYDDYQVQDSSRVQSYVLGCFNANNITLGNMTAVCYIPRDGAKDEEFHNYEGEFWCKILYYDEY